MLGHDGRLFFSILSETFFWKSQEGFCRAKNPLQDTLLKLPADILSY